MSDISTAPIDMILHCPRCHAQHIDEPEDGFHEGADAQAGAWSEGWSNPPHRSHLCHECGCIWRPADVPTNGVAAIQTKGKADTALTPATAPDREAIAWLIEWPQKGSWNARWWVGGYQWEPVTDRAVRFSRKEDAERVIRTVISGDPKQPDVVFDDIIATDHEWVKP